MATTTMVHVRMNKRLKERATKALEDMGLSVSTVVRVLLARVATEKAIPFQLRVPNAKTRAAMEELERGGLPRFRSVSGLMADLNADD
jgi:DNA-damage-inducible protein J